jgi:DNA polymerase-4
MAVCGSERDRHGIVLAKNELAKACGIKTAETVWSARKKCPNLVIAEPHYDAYADFSRRANAIYARYTDMIEPFGIDESWLDVTSSRKLFGTGYEIAEQISRDIKNELGITISVGVSFNKVFAKLGSDYKKPDAITVIDESNFRQIVYPLPASDLLFVGKKTAEQLRAMGIRTIGDLAAASPYMLRSRLGKAGEMLSVYARGEDDSPVCSEASDSKSVGNGYTFRHDLTSYEECRVGIEYLSDEIGARLRKKGMVCSTVQLSIKDEYLRVLQRQRPLDSPSDSATDIARCACAILRDEWSEGKPIRMLTVTAQGLFKKESYARQIDMFGETEDKAREKNEKKDIALDEIRSKYGAASITKASIINNGMGISYEKGKH